jgi:hypothetical protein
MRLLAVRACVGLVLGALGLLLISIGAGDQERWIVLLLAAVCGVGGLSGVLYWKNY